MSMTISMSMSMTISMSMQRRGSDAVGIKHMHSYPLAVPQEAASDARRPPNAHGEHQVDDAVGEEAEPAVAETRTTAELEARRADLDEAARADEPPTSELERLAGALSISDDKENAPDRYGTKRAHMLASTKP